MPGVYAWVMRGPRYTNGAPAPKRGLVGGKGGEWGGLDLRIAVALLHVACLVFSGLSK